MIWMLMIIAIVALMGTGALHDTWFAQSLTGAHLYEQRAWALAELGLRAGVANLITTPVPDEAPSFCAEYASQRAEPTLDHRVARDAERFCNRAKEKP